MTGRLNQVLVGFDYLFRDDRFEIVMKDVKFKTDVQEWIKTLVSAAKEWLTTDATTFEEDHSEILNILNADFFDENNIFNFTGHRSTIVILIYAFPPNYEVYFWFFNKFKDGEFVKFDSLKIMISKGYNFLFEIIDKTDSKHFSTPQRSYNLKNNKDIIKKIKIK